jgi:hypothetical protein
MNPKIVAEYQEGLCPYTNLTKNCIANRCAVWQWSGDPPHEFVRTVEIRQEYPDAKTDAELEQIWQKVHAQMKTTDPGSPGNEVRIVEQKGNWTLKVQIIRWASRLGYCGLIGD